jgi:hypothetical protein
MAGGATFKLDAKSFEKLQQAMANYSGLAGKVVNEVLHNEGGKLIADEIMRLLPESHRTWKGKKAAAKQADPFVQENGTLSVTIRTEPAYHYLYFPDDGSNTKNHNKQQYHFMQRGGENKQAEIINRCIARLTEEFEG